MSLSAQPNTKWMLASLLTSLPVVRSDFSRDVRDSKSLRAHQYES